MDEVAVCKRWDLARRFPSGGLTFHCAKKNGHNVAKPAAHQRNNQGRKSPVGAISGGDTRRTMAPKSGVPALSRFLHALREEKIPFLIAGMTAAVLQGVPVATVDVESKKVHLAYIQSALALRRRKK